MTTPMHVYEDIAIRYGAKSAADVSRFFEFDVHQLPVETRQAIFDELLDSHAVPSKPLRWPEETTTLRVTRRPPPPLRSKTLAEDPGELPEPYDDIPQRTATISDLATRVFGNQALALEWLSTPLTALAGKSPIDALKTGSGALHVEDLLMAIEHGI